MKEALSLSVHNSIFCWGTGPSRVPRWSFLLQYGLHFPIIAIPFCSLSFLSMVIPSLALSSFPLHSHLSLRMAKLSPWFTRCLIPEGIPGDATGLPRSHRVRSHSQSLKDTAGEIYRKEFTLSFPDCLGIFPLISSPCRIQCYFSASPHPTILASGEHISMTSSLSSRPLPSKPAVKNLQRYC